MDVTVEDDSSRQKNGDDDGWIVMSKSSGRIFDEGVSQQLAKVVIRVGSLWNGWGGVVKYYGTYAKETVE